MENTGTNVTLSILHYADVTLNTRIINCDRNF